MELELFENIETMSLKSILENCWTAIEPIYKQGNVCSERHLQAEIFNILQQNKQFKNEYQIFIEPSIYSDKNDFESLSIIGIIPDILITRQNKIICIFEIKYKPNGYVPYEKDFINFSKFNELRGTDFPIYLEVNPINGDWNYQRPFTVDNEILFAYGVIANEYADVLTKATEIWENLELIKQPIKNYIQLIGSVNKLTEAKFSWISNTEK